jgi:hypothetical protein
MLAQKGGNDMGTTIISLVITIIVGCLWGAATYTINENKGYYNNGFWWGFWLGLIGVIVVLCKPDARTQYYETYGYPSQYGNKIPEGGWKCTCGTIHSSYVTSCSCGKSKREVLNPTPAPKPQPSAMAAEDKEGKIIAALQEYKKLLDSGVLTQEEFEQKKQQLLGQQNP